MNIFKTSFLSAIETAVKLASGFVVIKYIAIETGPSGVAFFGQFQNFFSAFLILISGGFTTGLVRYSSQEKINATKKNYLGNALGIGLVVSLVTGGVVCFFANTLSYLTLNSGEFTSIFYLLALCGTLIMIYQVIISVLNGWGELYKLILCKLTCSLSLLIFSLIFVRLYGVYGGLIALVVMQSIGSLLALLLISKVKNFHWRWLIPRFDYLIFKDFVPYWLMGLVTLISTPLALMLIRTHIAAYSNWDVVGLWEASWKISELYLLVITTALTTYYVPKLSQAIDGYAENKTVVEVLTWGVIAAACLAIGVYSFRQLIVTLLFSNSFSAVSNLLTFQLLGSVIKIAAWVFAFHMLVKGNIKLFLISELVFGSTFYLLSILFFDYFGLIGLSYAYFLNYILYLIFCFVYYCQQYCAVCERESLLEKAKIIGSKYAQG